MKFVLFEKLAELGGLELALLICALVIAVALIAALIILSRRANAHTDKPSVPAPQGANVRALATGALCVSLSFILSYIKLFSMPMGGSVTLLSMLPVSVYACLYGRRNGFVAALAYAALQLLQGVYIVHWAQFILDYFAAFACYALASFFPRRLPLGVAVSGFSRMAVSTLSGVIFFSAYAAEAGYSSAVWYSIVYNASTIGVETVLCVVVSLLPPVARLFSSLRPKA